MADRYPCLGPMELGQIPSWETSKLEILLCAVLSLNKTFIQWESIKTIIWGSGGRGTDSNKKNIFPDNRRYSGIDSYYFPILKSYPHGCYLLLIEEDLEV